MFWEHREISFRDILILYTKYKGQNPSCWQNIDYNWAGYIIRLKRESSSLVKRILEYNTEFNIELPIHHKSHQRHNNNKTRQKSYIRNQYEILKNCYTSLVKWHIRWPEINVNWHPNLNYSKHSSKLIHQKCNKFDKEGNFSCNKMWIFAFLLKNAVAKWKS